MNLRSKFLLLFLIPLALTAQDRYMTRTGHVEFHSSTPLEDIDAENDKVTSVWDAASGALEFSMLIKAFAFEKALMQEHFNEDYMESTTFPKATFKGKLSGIGADELAKAGTYIVSVVGTITLHGVEKPVKTEGTVTVDAHGAIQATSTFPIRPEDHGIRIPGLVRTKIAEAIEVKVRMDFRKM